MATPSVLASWNTHVSNGALYALQYDLLNDFEPVALLASFSSMIAVRKSMPANDLKEFYCVVESETQARLSPGQCWHRQAWDTSAVSIFRILPAPHIQHVPYRGSAPAMQDLVSGQNRYDDRRPRSRSCHSCGPGTIKAFALLAKRRLAQARQCSRRQTRPDCPVFHVSNWFGFWVPRRHSQGHYR